MDEEITTDLLKLLAMCPFPKDEEHLFQRYERIWLILKMLLITQNHLNLNAEQKGIATELLADLKTQRDRENMESEYLDGNFPDKSGDESKIGQLKCILRQSLICGNSLNLDKKQHELMTKIDQQIYLIL